ncbi:MAG: hypothetical protein K6F76_03270 [Clostridiales bacterium]|nr:hypothetical protein [Clostridiales bacterium]
MFINPIIILITVAIVVIAIMYCIIKNTNFPILTLMSILIFGIYTSFAYLINSVIYSKNDTVFSSNNAYSLVKFITNINEYSYSALETAFSQYCAVMKVIMVVSIIFLAADIIRIFFKRK